MKSKTSKVLAVFLALCLLLSLVAPAFAAGNQITIGTKEELMAFAQNCTLDSWSQGKTVVLTDDIDLTGTDFTPIPTFGGHFDGQGHAITGISLDGSGSNRGLFRYLQTSAVVEDLKVEISIAPTDFQDSLGGLAGNNRGLIRNCEVTGNLKGESSVGGIVGINEAGGQVINCTFNGTVVATHYVGGIVGQNLGSILQCVNQGGINTVEIESSTDLDDLTDRQWNSTENVPTSTDIGGITGYSSGIVQSCKNIGAVGYAHIGYNVGGIAGRQAGYLDACTNEGFILGRKDVGGIVGQLEPEVFLRYGEDTLNSVWDKLDTLGDQVDGLLGTLDGANTSTTNQLNIISANATNAQNAASDLMDLAKDWANGNIDSINDLSARISWSLEQLEPILDTLTDLPDQMTKAVDHLNAGLDKMQDAGDIASGAMDSMKDAVDKAQDAADQLSSGMDHLQEAQDYLRAALGDSKELRKGLDQLANGVEELNRGMSQFSDAMDDFKDAVGQLPGNINGSIESFQTALDTLGRAGDNVSNGFSNINAALKRLRDNFNANGDPIESIKDALDELDCAVDDLQDASDTLSKAGNDLKDAMDALQDAETVLSDGIDEFKRAGDAMNDAFDLLDTATEDLHTMVKTLSEEPTISFDGIGSDITAKGDELDDAVSEIINSAKKLTDVVSGSADNILDDLSAISKQVQSITDLLREETQDAKDDADKDLVEDISDQVDSDQQRTGCISASTNNGKVEGDVDVAGIAGSMAIEYDFDPEDDLVKEGDRSLDITYQTKAVIRRSVNNGEITSKKDQAGGVVGRMDLGQVTHCENYGTVSSTDGSYVGGIAGGSWGTIRESWSRCTLSGEHYVGGIAGYATNLKNCRSAVEITDGKAYLGTIAGDRDTEGTITGNTFTHDSLGAIDGISYAGQATPVSFSALCASGAPSTFAQMTLTFQADGKLVKTVPFTYGEGIDSLPDIPAKKGYSAAWPDIDYSHLTASQTLEAVYTPYTSSLTDGGQLPEILVDGSFSAQAEVSHTSQEASWTTERGRTYTGQGYTVTVDDPTLDIVSYTVHCRIPEEGGRYSVWMEQDDGTWVRQDSTKDGNYLLFPATAQSVTFCLIKEPGSLQLLVPIGILAVGFLFLLWYRKKAKKKAQSGEKPQKTEKTPKTKKPRKKLEFRKKKK